MCYKIIVVDDNDSFRELIRKTVQKIKHVEIAATAGNGEEAVPKVRELKPDLVLLDIRMPGMDGIKTLEVIKRENPQIKVIMFTNYEMPEYRKATSEKGADGFVLKKELFRELVPMIEKLQKNTEDNPESD
ncbi:MAG: response regulator transcription factor [Fidelibacterota bacterium]